MKILFRSISCLISIVLLFSCQEQYTPPQITVNTNYLVVEGIINSSGTDSTFIKLSRSVLLNSKITTQTERKAKVTVESDANTSYLLTEIKAGTYSSVPLNLNNAAKYRLRIITSDNKTYLSDFVQVKNSPPIDSIGYKIRSDGLQIYANTHDATNNTRYYRWEYVETWNFHAAYATDVILDGTKPICRPAGDNIFSCWTNNIATDIVLASSAKLTQDVIFQTPLTSIVSSSNKLSIEYSILVRQYALTEDAFNFWQLLKKNTEQLGSIFDAQPSTITGNIHNIANSNEPVLGYISVGTIQQKRIFISNLNLPTGWGSDSQISICPLDTAFKAGEVPVGPCGTPIIITAWSPPPCVDCTLRGGSNKKPAYWPQ